MEPLLAQLKTFPGRLLALPMAIKVALISAVVIGLGVVGAARVVTDNAKRDYVFTSLSPSDSAACGDALTAASIPFSIEANGAAIAVPTDRVHEARLLLAGQGLPRGAGVGFELFDKGDLGVSEFTQRVNLQRAQEGELARTIQSLGPVREARVHLTLPKKGLFRDEDKAGQAAVMVRLHPGRALDESALSGIRHLVASAVPGLPPQAVTIIDDGGTLLGEANGTGGLMAAQKKLERSLEERLMAVLEPTVGKDAVVARVTAELDDAEEGATSSVFDPNGQVLRSERTRNDSRSDTSGQPGAVAGAAANTVLDEPGVLPADDRESQASRAENTRTWEITNTVTRRASRSPRLKRLSVAIVINDTVPPRAQGDVNRLAELARKAVGFDEDRGDQLEMSALPFVKPVEEKVLEPEPAPALPPYALPVSVAVAAAILVAVAVAVVLRRRKQKADAVALLARIAEEEKAKEEKEKAEKEAKQKALILAAGSSNTALETTNEDGVTVTLSGEPQVPATPQQKAIAYALEDPARAAMVLEAWLDDDVLRAAPSPGMNMEASRG
jgi:flagellar M-ring protein FliF